MRICVIDNLKTQDIVIKKIMNLYPKDEIIFFKDPLEGYKFIIQNGVNLLFIKIFMKRMEGYELATKVKKVHPDIKIFFISKDGENFIENSEDT